ncbi:MAG: MFS transporter [Holophaga sp.]|nr:MFS transporter [Holophaga sp.]
MIIQVLVIWLAFFVMGFGDVRGSFVGISKEVFGITAAQGGLIPFCGAVAFGLLALPAGIFATRHGKKNLMMLGLLVTALGHLLPCLLLHRFSHLLLAILVIAIGMTFLLVAGNPLLREVTEPARFARNLTFAQFIKSLGSIAGPFLIAWIVGFGHSWKGIFPVFTVIPLVTLLVIALVPIPETVPLEPATLRGILRVLRDRTITFKVLGMFLFVGSEMGMNTLLATHMWQTFDLSIEVEAIRYGQGLFWLAQGAGRMLGVAILNWIEPRHFFLGCALAGLAGLVGLIFGDRTVAVVSVALCGLSFSNIWPTLFAILLDSRPHLPSEIAGLAVMANVGGAVLPLAMGLVADLTAVRWCFLVPVVAFLYLVGLGLASRPQVD